MIYIIGVDHLIQYKNSIVPDIIYKQFIDFIEEQIRDYRIDLIAEEFNYEALKHVYHSDQATVKAIAQGNGIEHRYCDPGLKERKKLGIPFFADIKDMVRKKHNISEKFIFDTLLRKKIISETIKISRSYWKIREKFWLDKIRDRIDSEILFICGHEHPERFKKLLVENKYDCTIISEWWLGEIFSDYGNFDLE